MRRANENPFAQIPRREEVSKCSRLRRQRAVPKHNNVGRDALWQGGRCALAAKARERRKVQRGSAERHDLDSLRWTSRCQGSCGRSSKKCRCCVTTHGTGASPCMTNKSWRRPFSPKDSVVRSATEMVSRPWFENHSGLPNH